MRIQNVLGGLAFLAVLSTPVVAAEAEGGSDVASQPEFIAKVQACTLCHGEGDRDRPKGPTIPIVAGQHESYLLKQLTEFQHGQRANDVMEWMSKTLAPSELAPAASALAKMKWPARAANAAAGPAPTGVTICGVCHQQNLMGAARAEGGTAPRLAGQSYEYLVAAMREFADGKRTNSSDMVQIMKGISAADRDAIAKYLSNL